MGESKDKRLAKLRQADLYVVITEEFTAGRGTLRVLEEAADAGIRLCSMGPRILRCETAPLVALTALMYESGNLA